MNELDKLRPEVRDALMHIRPSAHRFAINSWNCVRAELLRLAARNAELEAKATRDHDWVSDLLADNKRAEAELAAIKARIAEAPVATLVISSAAGDLTLVWAENPDDWASKRVRLLVDEPPAKRGEG